MTVKDLEDFGADVQEGLARCLNKEDFYLKLVNMWRADKKIEGLGPALQSKDYDAAFEIIHALKGTLGNLALTPILKPVLEMTELLRSRTDTDYTPLYNEIMAQREKLLALP